MIKQTEREKAIVGTFKAGQPMQWIGNEWGISRERIRQILKKAGVSRSQGGASERRRRRTALHLEAKNQSCIEKHGMVWPAYRSLLCIGKGMQNAGIRRERTPIGAFARQRQNARKRGIEWKLTLGEWWDIWTSSGKWSERGRGRGYVMARIGDVGAYAPGNVKIITQVQNMDEYYERKFSP